MPRRKSVSDETVLDAALKVMFRKGPDEFTLAAVAVEAGIAPATLVQRFGTKRGLVLRAVARANAEFSERLAQTRPQQSAGAVIALLQAATPGPESESNLADQLLWMREDLKDPAMNALAREHGQVLRAALKARMPPLPIAAEEAVRLVEAQWQGALQQWGLEPDGSLRDYVGRSLAAWFRLVDPRLK